MNPCGEPHCSLHAKRRIKERLNLPARAAARLTKLAWEQGLPWDHPDVPKDIQDIARKVLRNDRAPTANVRVFRGAVYLFGLPAPDGGLILITVFLTGAAKAKAASENPNAENPRLLDAAARHARLSRGRKDRKKAQK